MMSTFIRLFIIALISFSNHSVIASDYCTASETAKNIFTIGSKVYIQSTGNNLWRYENKTDQKFVKLKINEVFGDLFDEIQFAVTVTKLNCGKNCGQIDNLVIAVGLKGPKLVYSTYRLENDEKLVKADELPSKWGLKSSGFVDSEDMFWGKQMTNLKIEDFFYYKQTFFVGNAIENKKHTMFWKTIEKNGSLPKEWRTQKMARHGLIGRSAFVVDEVYTISDINGKAMIVSKFDISLSKKGITTSMVTNFKNIDNKEFFMCLTSRHRISVNRVTENRVSENRVSENRVSKNIRTSVSTQLVSNIGDVTTDVITTRESSDVTTQTESTEIDSNPVMRSQNVSSDETNKNNSSGFALNRLEFVILLTAFLFIVLNF